MRLIITSALLFYSVCTFTQNVIQGVVRDSETKEALPFCSIAVKGTKKGTITNRDGAFSIAVNLTRDTLLFSYVGYNTLMIPVLKLVQKNVVLLESKQALLQEVTIHAKDDFLYDLIDKCRKKLMKDQSRRTAKVYYGIETATEDQPVEQLECYYNGYLEGASVESLLLKNGRIGLAELDNHYFLTLNSSKAMINMGLTNYSEFYPSTPFQLSRREMKKLFRVELSYEDDKLYEIKFQPRTGKYGCFSGEIWMDKVTYSLLKADFTVTDTPRHPFLPLFPQDSISHVDLTLSRAYRQEGVALVPDHINFTYHVTYKSVRDSLVARVPSIITREINTTGIIYFYDYGDPFILPYFDYDANYDDYRKISIIPYNEVFWTNNNALLLTDRQKENLGFFTHRGQLVNFREGNYGKDFLRNIPDSMRSTLYEFYYSFWSPDKRISLDKKLQQNQTYRLDKMIKTVQSDLYNLEVQILLDVTQLDDSLCIRSYAVFDANKTYFHIPEQSYTNAFLNIYFDLCEVERRKMQKELESHLYSVSQIDSVYKMTSEGINSLTQQYLREVQLGKEEKALKKWNDYIQEHLGIDNLKIFTESYHRE
jgi:hypothetical protein